MVYTVNLRRARATDSYTLKGEGVETWEPRFTFHGFRYVEVTGYPGTPALDAIEGVVTHSATPPAGSFECSHPMVNQLMSNIVWGQRCNFLEVPTDCPQRDERLGWTGDAQVFIRTAATNMDVAAFFTKWLIDLNDAQQENGAYPHVAPDTRVAGYGSPAWGDAGVICPYVMWRVYGDTRVIERHYGGMQRWIEYMKTNSTGLLRPEEGFGDWLSIQADTPRDVLATAYFGYCTALLAQMARVIGKNEDAQGYEALFAQIKAAFNQAYVGADGRIKGDTQTCYLLAVRMGLVEGAMREKAIEYLVADINRRGHLSTGFVGISYLTPTLTATGHLDVAYKLLFNETFPSWGYPIKHGATTMWERWDGWTEHNGFQDHRMNSFNHYSFGSIGEWLYGAVAGIDAGEPGFATITLAPQPGVGMDWVKAEQKTIRGTIAAQWRQEGGVFTYEVQIPANTTATLRLPTSDPASVRESGQAVTAAEGVQALGYDEVAGAARFQLGSGRYVFTATRA
jgi:alpha-L-rhamnosidase